MDVLKNVKISFSVLDVPIHFWCSIDGSGAIPKIVTNIELDDLPLSVYRLSLGKSLNYYLDAAKAIKIILKKLIPLQLRGLVSTDILSSRSDFFIDNLPHHFQSSPQVWINKLNKNRYFYEPEYHLVGNFLTHLLLKISAFDNWEDVVRCIPKPGHNPLIDGLFLELIELDISIKAKSVLLEQFLLFPSSDKIDILYDFYRHQQYFGNEDLNRLIISYHEDDIVKSIERNSENNRQRYIVGGKILEEFYKYDALCSTTNFPPVIALNVYNLLNRKYFDVHDINHTFDLAFKHLARTEVINYVTHTKETLSTPKIIYSQYIQIAGPIIEVVRYFCDVIGMHNHTGEMSYVKTVLRQLVMDNNERYRIVDYLIVEASLTRNPEIFKIIIEVLCERYLIFPKVFQNRIKYILQDRKPWILTWISLSTIDSISCTFDVGIIAMFSQKYLTENDLLGFVDLFMINRRYKIVDEELNWYPPIKRSNSLFLGYNIMLYQQEFLHSIKTHSKICPTLRQRPAAG